MKKIHLLYIVCLLLSSSLLLNGLAQDFAAQWHLPEGAKARLGRGKLINIKLSSDSTRVVVSTSIGIWIYDAQTNEVVSLFTEKQTGEKDRFLSKRPPEALTFSPERVNCRNCSRKQHLRLGHLHRQCVRDARRTPRLN